MFHQLDRPLVVTLDENSLTLEVQVVAPLFQPQSLFRCVRGRHVLSLYTGERHSWLKFAGPRDCPSCYNEDISRRQSPRVYVPSMICITEPLQSPVLVVCSRIQTQHLSSPPDSSAHFPNLQCSIVAQLMYLESTPTGCAISGLVQFAR
jgi:hypothetical protein